MPAENTPAGRVPAMFIAPRGRSLHPHANITAPAVYLIIPRLLTAVTVLSDDTAESVMHALIEYATRVTVAFEYDDIGRARIVRRGRRGKPSRSRAYYDYRFLHVHDSLPETIAPVPFLVIFSSSTPSSRANIFIRAGVQNPA